MLKLLKSFLGGMKTYMNCFLPPKTEGKPFIDPFAGTIWLSKEPCTNYPDYTTEDISLLKATFEKNKNEWFENHTEGWIESIIEKPTKRWCVSTTLSMPLSMVSEELRRIDETEKLRKKRREDAGFKPGDPLGDKLMQYGRPIVEAEIEAVLRWRLAIRK